MLLPFNKLAIANKQLSLSLIISAYEVIFLDWISNFWCLVILESSLSISGVSASSTFRLKEEFTKL
jgi:hypothetical protein